MSADPLSQVFSALADPTRRDIVARLASGDATVGELAAPYPVTVQAVSKHLKVLQEAGLVSRGRDAQRRPVHLEAEVFDLMTMWIERHRREAALRDRQLEEALVSEGDGPPADPARSGLAEPRTQAGSRPPAGADRVFEPWDLAARAERVARPGIGTGTGPSTGTGTGPGTVTGTGTGTPPD